jgi:hypothetical protein
MEGVGLSWPFGAFYNHLVYFMNIFYILCSFGIFFPCWYVVTRKIWQPCFTYLLSHGECEDLLEDSQAGGHLLNREGLAPGG